ncbi:hypothetical protein [Streptococcus ferus]|uniref:hypothetical protein n=1 Tax=Streptococcus ferus TaxID=1345 RepID=UPI00235573EB|nr:hypothetical protein [Streptococcus ferus]
MRKRLSLLLVLFLGGIVIMTGCRENKNSRQWIENKVSAVSRVYPTEDLFDLFKEFPEGFEIRIGDVYKKTSDTTYLQEMELTGNPKTKGITGTLKRIKRESSGDEIVLASSDMTYTEQGFILSNSELSSDDIIHKEILIEKLSLNKERLAKFPLNNKSYSWETGDAFIEYTVVDSVINKYFGLNQNAKLKLGIDVTNSMLIGYQYGFVLSVEGNGVTHTEKFYSQKINEEALKNSE